LFRQDVAFGRLEAHSRRRRARFRPLEGGTPCTDPILDAPRGVTHSRRREREVRA
jgi:hypothetical protein